MDKTKGKGHYITNEERKILATVLGEHGYLTQVSVATYLHKKDFGKSVNSMKSYWHQIVNGAYPLPQYLAENIVSMCNNDERISFLLTPSLHSPLLRKHFQKSPWGTMLLYYLDRIVAYYNSADDGDKLRILQDLDNAVTSKEMRLKKGIEE